MEKDYKKLYEEALEKAKFLKENTDGVGAKYVSRCFEEIFPELAESEDEKIRKEIIQFLQLPHPQFVGKRNHEEWIAWLEKQGERKSTCSGEDDKVFKDIYKDLHSYYTLKANMLVYDTYKKEYEKQWEDAKKWLEEHVAS